MPLTPEEMETAWPDLSKSGVKLTDPLSRAIGAMPDSPYGIVPVLKKLVDVKGSNMLVPALLCYDPILYAVDHVRGNADCELKPPARPVGAGRRRLHDSEYVDAWCMVTLLQVCWPALSLDRIYELLADAPIPTGHRQKTFISAATWKTRYQEGSKIVKALPCSLSDVTDDLRGRRWLALADRTPEGLRRHYKAGRYKADKKKRGSHPLKHLNGAISYNSAVLLHLNRQMYRIRKKMGK